MNEYFKGLNKLSKLLFSILLHSFLYLKLHSFKIIQRGGKKTKQDKKRHIEREISFYMCAKNKVPRNAICIV